jgi:hypothetical protein
MKGIFMGTVEQNKKIVEQRAVEIATKVDYALASPTTKPIDRELMTGQANINKSSNSGNKGGK